MKTSANVTLMFVDRPSSRMIQPVIVLPACFLIFFLSGVATQGSTEKYKLFTLVAFDRLSLRNMYIQNHFRCQRFPMLYNQYESLTTEQLGRALNKDDRDVYRGDLKLMMLLNSFSRQWRLEQDPHGGVVASDHNADTRHLPIKHGLVSPHYF
ncbi:hypothetical protein JG688_00017495 [Phytophthora aleatoria]|uniref:Uncharacterized protein n=1 Tax=Phytophthora aleatoria TaxID=2496075 RepID=A0A8J5IAE3_9STRA|nr:hypothetical protein JG688_00017495 [Phytophthora aleatoria]